MRKLKRKESRQSFLIPSDTYLSFRSCWWWWLLLLSLLRH